MCRTEPRVINFLYINNGAVDIENISNNFSVIGIDIQPYLEAEIISRLFIYLCQIHGEYLEEMEQYHGEMILC